MSEAQKSLADLVGIATVLSFPIINPELDRPYAIVPEGFKLQDLESYMPAPVRIRQAITHRSVESFLSYVERFLSPQTVVFAVVDENNPKFTACFDYHNRVKHEGGAVDEPSWCGHRAVLESVPTPEWTTWKGNNKKQFNQRDFALFIEDNAPDIIEPKSADMLAMSRSIIAKKNVDFSSDIRLDNGQVQFTYIENIQGSMQKGNMAIPERFRLQIPVFQGGETYEFEARFRYSIADGGKLALSYDLHRAHKIIEAAAKRVMVQIQTKFPGVPIFTASVT